MSQDLLIVYAMEVRIAVVQQNVLQDLEQTLEMIRSSVAGIPEPDLVLLPELFATGYEFPDIKTGLKRSQRALDFMRELSRETGALIGGTLITEEDSRFYNTFLMVVDREILHRQHKTHLFKPMREDQLFSPGNSIKAFESPIGTIGVFICYELRFPEIARKLVSQGAELLLVPAEWPRPRQEVWKLLCRARAAENQVFLASANRWGPGGESFYGGNSGVYDPNGTALVQITDGAGAAWADIELEQLREIRSSIPVWQDRREELY